MIFYTDGSCKRNGKTNAEGGFGVVCVSDDRKELISTYSKHCDGTTNNREELKAILYVMLNYGVKDYNFMTFEQTYPLVYSDSSYAINTLTNWMFTWANNGWIKSDKKTPENLDLIKQYYDHYQKGYRIELRKVKGHSGEKWNELADHLATLAADNHSEDDFYNDLIMCDLIQGLYAND